MMNRFILKFMTVGFSIPLCWLFLWHWILKSCSSCLLWMTSSAIFEVSLIIVWPSSIFLIGDPLDNNWQLTLFSIFINCVIYFFIGLFVWLFRFKSSYFMFPIAFFYIGLFVFIYKYILAW